MVRDGGIEGADWRMDLEAAMVTLTQRQREVVALVVQGYTQEEIGERLGVAQQVVGEHWLAAVKKLEQSLN